MSKLNSLAGRKEQGYLQESLENVEEGGTRSNLAVKPSSRVKSAGVALW